MKLLKYILGLLLLASCSNTDDEVKDTNVLSNYINNRATEAGAVIACSASNELNTAVLTFYYPVEGATNIKFFETENALVDKLDYTKYKTGVIENAPFFNGYLGRFTTENLSEHWIIVTFEFNGEIKISNPIRTKQINKPTVWNSAVTIDQANALMPVFSWQDNALGDNAIYFQVVSDVNNNLLSGTYTNEASFQYYNTENVVFNITTVAPPNLEAVSQYNFTLMDVSEDNWVNLVSQKSFTIQ